jgi:hypothetical protein
MRAQIKAGIVELTLAVYWLALPLLLLFVMLMGANTPSFLPSVLAALLACGIALHVAGYQWMSFSCLFVIGHIVQYPLAALIILCLSDPQVALEGDLWDLTPQSMWCLVLAMVGLCIGFMLGKSLFGKQSILEASSGVTDAGDWLISRRAAVTLSLMSVLVAAWYMTVGIYYHKNVQDYNLSAAETFGFVGYLCYVSMLGPILQLKRYLLTRTRADLVITLLCFLIMFCANGPSGSRRHIMLPLLGGFLYFLQKERVFKTKLLVAALGGTLFCVMLPLLETYRTVYAADSDTIARRLFDLFRAILSFDFRGGANHPELFWITLGRRLADYVSVGYLIDIIPTKYGYVGFSDVGQWPLYILPTLIRPASTLSFTYDATYMDQYMFRPMEIIGGSSPLMYIGDLYNRAGYLAVFFGMVVTGVILLKLDRWLLSDRFRTTVIWVFMLDTMSYLHGMTLLKFFVLLTRQLFIYFVIAIVLQAMLKLPFGVKRSPASNSAACL